MPSEPTPPGSSKPSPELEALAKVLPVDPLPDPTAGERRSILERWGLTERELTELLDTVPSVRGMMLGAVAELKLKKILEAHKEVTATVKYDDHNRKKKGDRYVTYRGAEFSVESKSLQTAKNKKVGDKWAGETQVDASDRRKVTFSDGSTLETTCLLRAKFPDILAVNLFSFEDDWRFIFARREALPASRHKGYTEFQKSELLATAMKVTWPPEPPFVNDPFELIEQLYQERHAKK